MKRNRFLNVLFMGGYFLMTGTTALARRIYSRTQKGFMVRAGQDRKNKPITLLEGDTFYTKISSQDTDSTTYAFESTRLKKGGPALHVHPEQDEWWYVLEGEFLIRVGDETWPVKQGDSAFGPKGIPHTFAKTNEGNARLLIIFQPAGKMEEWFQLVSEGKIGLLSEQEQNAQRKAHGFERVGPAIDYLKKY